MLDLSKNVNLFQGDCLGVMDKLIEQGVVVDAIITDPLTEQQPVNGTVLYYLKKCGLG